LFIKKNIESTTFSEIAALAGVGEATVYRHYPNKEVLAIAVAVENANEFNQGLETFINNFFGNDLERFEKLLEYYVFLYRNKPEYFILVEHFDNYIAHLEVKPQGINQYEEVIINAYKLLKPGDEVEWDESVSHIENCELTIHTYVVSFVSFIQKLLLRGKVIARDDTYNNDIELEIMRKALVHSIKSKDLY
jgi:AcrR family transcriptional regulator